VRPKHLRPSLVGKTIRFAKYLLALLFGMTNIMLFSQTFISAVDYHNRLSPGITPGRIALISLGPVEFVLLAVAIAASWRSDRLARPTRLVCLTLGGECALNWTIFIVGGGLALITLGI
jgi:hypothetical protein